MSNRPDVRHLLLTEDDAAIVIASDGLTDVMSDQDAADMILAILREQVDLAPLHLSFTAHSSRNQKRNSCSQRVIMDVYGG